jgi:NAD(P)-dependent dehydrogenase (short-subunit alcohol dehydrogenase family)
MLVRNSGLTLQNFHEITVSVDLDQASLPEIFEFLEEQTELRFLYNKEIIEKSRHRLDLDLHQVSMADVLREVGLQTGLGFRQINGLKEDDIKRMVERRSGKIIFTASLLSFQGGITVPGYTASKSAIAGLTRALANEWAPHGVNVNAIAPGYMETDNTRALRRDPVRSQAILERIPAGRWGSAEDVVGAAVFLASSSADYIHGTVLTVDGGWMGR